MVTLIHVGAMRYQSFAWRLRSEKFRNWLAFPGRWVSVKVLELRIEMIVLWGSSWILNPQISHNVVIASTTMFHLVETFCKMKTGDGITDNYILLRSSVRPTLLQVEYILALQRLSLIFPIYIVNELKDCSNKERSVISV